MTKNLLNIHLNVSNHHQKATIYEIQINFTQKRSLNCLKPINDSAKLARKKKENDKLARERERRNGLVQYIHMMPRCISLMIIHVFSKITTAYEISTNGKYSEYFRVFLMQN